MLKKSIESLNARLDDQEQRGRNMCLIAHGVTEEEGEHTDDLIVNLINNELALSRWNKVTW